MKRARTLARLSALAFAFVAAAALAAGPLVICPPPGGNVPIKYASNSVTLNYDLGNLGTRSKATADALVTSSVALWTNVATSNLVIGRGADLLVDVTASNWATYFNNSADGLNPVIYDTDGSIIDDIFGAGASNSVLGVAGSGYFYGTTCGYTEGRAVISGKLSVSDATMSIVFAHEIGHLVGLDHTQIDSGTIPGLTAASYPLMYPIAYRNTPSVGEDDIASVSALYPDTTLSGTYGQLSGTLTLADGVTVVKGANIVAKNVADPTKSYSVVSDYLIQGNGYFKLLLPAGTYNLLIEAIDSSFTGGSSVGPYSELSTDPSFLPPLYVGGVPMATVTLGGSASPTQITITAGCMATLPLRLDGTGTVTGNCNVTPPPPANGKVGVFRGGFWFVDKNGNNTWDSTPTDGFFAFGSPTDIPVVGDWNGDGKAKIGVFRDGFFFLDYNGNGVWDGGAIDRFYAFGTVGDKPVVGDWNGDGKAKIGVFRGGFFFLDYNGNGLWEGHVVDRGLAFGLATDTPVIGDWNGSGTSKIGVFRSGFFFLDYNGNGVWEGHLVDRGLAFGAATDVPVIGDWNGSGTSKVGVFRNGFWFTDLNGSGVWDGTPTDQFFAFGTTGDIPMAGKGW